MIFGKSPKGTHFQSKRYTNLDSEQFFTSKPQNLGQKVYFSLRNEPNGPKKMVENEFQYETKVEIAGRQFRIAFFWTVWFISQRKIDLLT